MKYLMVPLLLIAAFFNRGQCMTDAELDMYFQMYKRCQALTGVADDIIEGTKDGKFPDDSAFKEHLLCVLKEAGFRDKDDYINMEAFGEYLKKSVPDPVLREEIINSCPQRRETPQETVFHYAKCMFGYNDRIGLNM